jgi:hypothetical protein
MKAAIESGQVGRPVLFRSNQRDRQAPPAAFCDPVKSGGIFLDMGIHEFDLARWLLGDEVESVQPRRTPSMRSWPRSVILTTVINLRFRSGAVGRWTSAGMPAMATSGRCDRLTGLPPAPPGPNARRMAARPTAADAGVRCHPEQCAPAATGKDSRAALAVALAARNSRRPADDCALGLYGHSEPRRSPSPFWSFRAKRGIACEGRNTTAERWCITKKDTRAAASAGSPPEADPAPARSFRAKQVCRRRWKHNVGRWGYHDG